MRRLNFPSEISENIAQSCLYIYYGIYTTWSTGTSTGDLLDFNNNLIEVKGFTSSGPISFGPTESWSKIVFIDGTDYINYNFKCYLCSYSNNSDNWKNIKINKKQTYNDIILQGKRPRINFSQLKKEFDNCNIKLIKIFDGHIQDIINKFH